MLIKLHSSMTDDEYIINTDHIVRGLLSKGISGTKLYMAEPYLTVLNVKETVDEILTLTGGK